MASQALTKGALWMQNVDYPASWDRIFIDSVYANEGVLEGFAVTPAGGLGISIAGGRAVVQGDEVVGQGKYLVDQDAAVTLTLASVGANRTEYVWLSINDTAVSGGRAGNNVSINTSTTVPPDSALILATLTLPLGASTITTGMIADSRLFTDVVPPGSITTAKLAPGSVQGAAIADSSITTAKIASGAVVAAKIGNLAVSTAKIDDGAVTTIKLADESVTLAKLSSTLTALIEAIDPADKIIAIGGTTAPIGWGMCDGAAVSRATYPATFARLGITHGAGDGSTTFNLPDLRNRFIAGKGPAAWSDVVGEPGGNKDIPGILQHTHANSVSASGSQPSHTHGVTVSGTTSTTGAHGHGLGSDNNNSVLYNNAIPGGAGGLAAGVGGIRISGPWVDYGAAGGDHNHSVTSTGGTGGSSDDTVNVSVTVTGGNVNNGFGLPVLANTDQNLPPYRTLNYCIRLR